MLLKATHCYGARRRSQSFPTKPQHRASDTHSNPKTDLGAPYPITDYVNYDHFSLAHRAFLASISQEKDHVTYIDAVKDSWWRDAMKSEIHALETNGTWTITQLPLGKKELGCKWVYKIKHKYDGSVEQFKARLVIQRERKTMNCKKCENNITLLFLVDNLTLESRNVHVEIEKRDSC